MHKLQKYGLKSKYATGLEGRAAELSKEYPYNEMAIPVYSVAPRKRLSLNIVNL